MNGFKSVSIPKYYSISEFVDTFKVGDFIKAKAWGKVVQITAIGKYRFLYENTEKREVPKFGKYRVDLIEFIASIENVPWIKVVKI